MKKIKCILLICIFFSCFCGQAVAEEQLTIYVPRDDIALCENLERGIQLMKKKHPDLTIFSEYLPGYWFDSEYAKRLSTELMAGGGPDVIVLNATTFPDMIKAARSNLFADLSEFLVDDTGFDRGNYIQPALDSGVINGKQLYIPLFLEVPFLITTTEQLSAYGLKNPQHTSLDMVGFLKPLTEVDTPGYLSIENAAFTVLPSASGIQFVDYDNGSSNPSQDSLQTFLELSREIYVHDMKITEGTVFSSTLDLYNGLANDDFVYGLEYYDFSTILITNSLLSKSHTPVTVALPTMDGGVHANTSSALAININSHNQKSAYEFIKIMLSKEVMYPDMEVSNYNIHNIPINTAGWRDSVAECVDFMVSNGLGGTDLPTGEIPQDVLDYLCGVPGMITECSFQNYQVLTMYMENMKPYFDGTTTLDEALHKLQFKLELYASE